MMWETGKPKKDGQYLCSVGEYAVEPYYKCVYFQNGEWEEDVWDIVAWQEIEPYTPPRKAVYEFDMPKDCGECPLCSTRADDFTDMVLCWCNALKTRPVAHHLAHRPKECPLKEAK